MTGAGDQQYIRILFAMAGALQAKAIVSVRLFDHFICFWDSVNR